MYKESFGIDTTNISQCVNYMKEAYKALGDFILDLSLNKIVFITNNVHFT